MEFLFSDINLFLFLGFAILFAFYTGQIAQKMKIPMIIGYLGVGALLGPSGVHLIDADGLERLSFIIDLGLGIIAFSIGTELDFSSLKRLGLGIITVIFAESFGAFLVVFGFIYLFSHDTVLSILFAAIAPASAPAGTVAVIKEYKAKGPMTKALYAVVGFDDALGIIIFGFALVIAKALLISHIPGNNGVLSFELWQPLGEISWSIALGAVVGMLMIHMAEQLGENGKILLLIIGVVLFLTGIALQFHGSLILTNMAAGIILTNFSHKGLLEKVRSSIDHILPLVFVLFFLVAGLHLELALLPALGILGVIYIVGRTVGLMGGAYLGSVLGDMSPIIRNYLGFGILSQAGLAIGMGFMVKNELSKLAVLYQIPDIATIGTTILMSVTATSIFFEIIGPITTKFALAKAGEIEQEPNTKENS